MSPRSYLGRLARRAGPDPPGFAPPRLAGAGPAITPLQEQPPPAGGRERPRSPSAPAPRRLQTAPDSVAQPPPAAAPVAPPSARASSARAPVGGGVPHGPVSGTSLAEASSATRNAPSRTRKPQR